MLGIVARRKIDRAVLEEFRELAIRGKTYEDFGCETADKSIGHQDGWGIACLSSSMEVYKRSGLSASKDPRFEEMLDLVVRAEPPIILLAHVRRTSDKSTVSKEKSHPFMKERHGRKYYFEHNGGIRSYEPVGEEIDSEYIFETFLRFLDYESTELEKLSDSIDKGKEAIEDEYGDEKITSLTFLLTEGSRLIAHRDARICAPYYSLYWTEAEGQILVSSETLESIDGNWVPFGNNQYLMTDRNLYCELL